MLRFGLRLSEGMTWETGKGCGEDGVRRLVDLLRLFMKS